MKEPGQVDIHYALESTERGINLKRVGRINTIDRANQRIIFTPNFPQYGEGLFVHGPDIIQTAVQAVQDELGITVEGIRGVSFLKPVTRNHNVLITPNRDELIPGSYAVGTLATNTGDLHFAVLADPPNSPSPEIYTEQSTVFARIHQRSTISNGISHRVEVPAGTESVKPLAITEILLQAGHTITNTIMPQIHQRASRQIDDMQPYWTSIDNLNVKEIIPGFIYHFDIPVSNIVPKGNSLFINCTYRISDGTKIYAEGNISFCIKVTFK